MVKAAAGEEGVIAKNGKPLTRLTMLAPAAQRPPPRFASLICAGWEAPENVDDPNPEIEALFNHGPVFPVDDL